MKTEPTKELSYRAETCSSPIGETGDYDSWIELVTPDFNLQCYDPDIEFEQVEELANLLNKATSSPKIKKLEWVDVWDGYEDARTPFGHYVVRPTIDNKTFSMIDIRKRIQPYSTLNEAKAAAQTDFERRVMECIDIE